MNDRDDEQSGRGPEAPAADALEAPAGPAVRTGDGAMARVEREGGVERLRVRDPAGRLVFEYAQGRMVLCAPDGDLELRAPRGQVRVEGARGVVLDGGASSSVTVAPGGVRVDAERLDADLGRATVNAGEASLKARVLRTVADRARAEVEHLEVRAGRVIERAREAYRETEGLSQTRAGRLKFVAEKALQALAEDVTVKARRDAKIKGEKIYLA